MYISYIQIYSSYFKLLFCLIIVIVISYLILHPIFIAPLEYTFLLEIIKVSNIVFIKLSLTITEL